jgi:hypothetical protein
MKQYYMVMNPNMSRDVYSKKYYKIDKNNFLYVKENGKWKILKNIGNNWTIIQLKNQKKEIV